MSVDVEIPKIGESITTVFIATWLKQPGDSVAVGDSILEVDSDKASMEIPSPVAGVITEVMGEEGDEVDIGSVVARIKEGAVAAAPAAASAPAAADAASSDDVKAGPAARQSAQKSHVDLHGVTGSGPRGRITTEDVSKAKAPKASAPPAASAKASATKPAPGRIERVAMTPLRRTIARRLVEAQQTAALLTTFNEVDMTEVMALRKQYQDVFVKKYGIKLGFMSFFTKAVIAALQEFPAVNSEIDGTDILYKHFYNIGMAVSGPKGLMVPVIRDADQLSMAETEQAIREVAIRARDGKLKIADFQDGTFTITNGGVFGSMMSTPIINPPQVGILGMHNIVKRAMVVNDEIVIRPMMYLALSYDHRVIDGKGAVSFLVRVKELIEDPRRLLIEI
ncbi:MAG: 2-oxoglutarate dehydrogenase E2 component (dihydrolipoamide succinyltransferase) [Myxococcota bacterium]|jgi:2-oxoglutarate dehydrogenase E2 component (dihydrolipoamide succinyltransferase)